MTGVPLYHSKFTTLKKNAYDDPFSYMRVCVQECVRATMSSTVTGVSSFSAVYLLE